MPKHLELTVFEPGELVATWSTDGMMTFWLVQGDGQLALASSNPMPSTDDPPDIDRNELIDGLDLSTRAFNVLKREGIHTIGALLDVYDEKGADGMMDTMRNFGQQQAEEIQKVIAELRSHGTWGL